MDIEQGLTITQWVESVFGPAGLILVMVCLSQGAAIYFGFRFMSNKHEAERVRWAERDELKREDMKECFSQVAALAEGSAQSREKTALAMQELSLKLDFLKPKN